MDGSFGDLAVVTAAAAPIVVALVQAAKAAGITGSRWAALVAILCGILVEGLVAATNMVDGFDVVDDWALVILGGIVAGLAAAGIYSGGKAVAGAALVLILAFSSLALPMGTEAAGCTVTPYTPTYLGSGRIQYGGRVSCSGGSHSASIRLRQEEMTFDQTVSTCSASGISGVWTCTKIATCPVVSYSHGFHTDINYDGGSRSSSGRLFVHVDCV